MIRWAMIGTGRMAAKMAADFAAVPDTELACIVSRSAEKGRAFADQWGVPQSSSDLAEVVQDPGVDAVYVATPHPSHFGLAATAIRAGKHTLVEKPMTMTAAEARELARLAADSQVFLMEAMWMRFNHAVSDVLDVVRARGIGDVRTLHATFGLPIPYDPQTRLWNPSLGGGTTLDQGVYPLSLAHLLFGPPDAVTARGQMLPDGVDSEASVMLSYSGGRQAMISTSLIALHEMTASIAGTGGRIELPAPFWSTDRYTKTATDFSTERIDYPLEGNGYVPMLAAAASAIASGRLESDLYPLSASIAVMEVVDEVLAQLRASVR